MAGAGATRTTLAIDLGVIVGFQFPVCVCAATMFGVDLHRLFQLVALTNMLSAVAYAAVYARGRWTHAFDVGRPSSI